MSNFIPNLRFGLMGLLVALSFLLQSLIPTGYMPELGSDKLFQIVICQGAEQTTILVDENMQPVHDESPDQTTPSGTHGKADLKPCVFSSFTHASLQTRDFYIAYIERLTYAKYVERHAQPTPYRISIKPYNDRAPPASYA